MGNIQESDAVRLRNNWKGGECEHPSFAKEYYLGSSTGDYICDACGKSFTRDEVDVIDAKREK